MKLDKKKGSLLSFYFVEVNNKKWKVIQFEYIYINDYSSIAVEWFFIRIDFHERKSHFFGFKCLIKS